MESQKLKRVVDKCGYTLLIQLVITLIILILASFLCAGLQKFTYTIHHELYDISIVVVVFTIFVFLTLCFQVYLKVRKDSSSLSTDDGDIESSPGRHHNAYNVNKGGGGGSGFVNNGFQNGPNNGKQNAKWVSNYVSCDSSYPSGQDLTQNNISAPVTNEGKESKKDNGDTSNNKWTSSYVPYATNNGESAPESTTTTCNVDSSATESVAATTAVSDAGASAPSGACDGGGGAD